MGPLNLGLPESTGDVGFAPSVVIKVSGDAGSRLKPARGDPTTQALAAAPGQSTAGVALKDCPLKNPSIDPGLSDC